MVARSEEFFLKVDMMGGRVVLGPIICKVSFARTPKEFELLLAFVIAEPVKAHIHGFCAFRLDRPVNDAICHGIISLNRRRGLFMSHFV